MYYRQRVESLILSSQISTNPQRVFLGGDTVRLSFNIGMVCLYICKVQLTLCCKDICTCMYSTNMQQAQHYTLVTCVCHMHQMHSKL